MSPCYKKSLALVGVFFLGDTCGWVGVGLELGFHVGLERLRILGYSKNSRLVNVRCMMFVSLFSFRGEKGEKG